MIAENHPLADTKITKAYPLTKYLMPCLLCCDNDKVEDNSASIVQPLINEADRRRTITTKGGKVKSLNKPKRARKNNVPKTKIDKDPINRLGYGIVAYRDLLYTMIWMFLILTLLAFPSLYFFS